ncbi:MAG: hypothetical protein WCA06_15370, partial [Terrimicrobiaceae bacterium]
VRTARKAVKIEYKGAQAFSAAVHSDDVSHVCKSSKCAGISASPDRLPRAIFRRKCGRVRASPACPGLKAVQVSIAEP